MNTDNKREINLELVNEWSNFIYNTITDRLVKQPNSSRWYSKCYAYLEMEGITDGRPDFMHYHAAYYDAMCKILIDGKINFDRLFAYSFT
ncbi:MAG: hypothetical protein E7129_05905 [Rikenellaceae bacterium]|nr:hypothetical protein [Rikenellaceae bacterium]